MLRLLHRTGPEGVLQKADPESASSLVAGEGWIWLDVAGTDPDVVARVGAWFGLDQLALDDVLEETHFPKIDDFGRYVFVVLHGTGQSGQRLGTSELDAFVGAGFLITFHREDVPALDWAWENSQVTAAVAEGGPDRMLARIAEIQGRRYLPLLDALDDHIEVLEERALLGDPAVIGEVQALRRDAVVLRRIVGPQREVLMYLSQERSMNVSPQARLAFSSVYDHYYRTVESLDASRSLLASVLDTYRSTVAERMNEVMKVLTVYAAILLPLSLLAGIYGMNFDRMPELGWRWAYFALLGVMATVALGQWLYFARRGFIGGPKLLSIPVKLGKGLAHLAAAPVRAIIPGSGRNDAPHV
jgi:magnesium transporter